MAILEMATTSTLALARVKKVSWCLTNAKGVNCCRRRRSSIVCDGSQKRVCLYIGRTVRKGETLKYPGTIVIKGDVDEGASVHANGDIIIIGKLHGKVYAGENGDKNAIVLALQTEPSNLGIKDNGLLAGEQLDGERKVPGNENSQLWLAKITRKSTKMAFFTGAYILVVGFSLLLFPRSLFGLFFDLQTVTIGWVRVGAILAMVFGTYYLGTAWGDAKGYNGADAFYLSTVVGRMFLFLGFCYLVGVAAAPPALLMVGCVNFVGAMLMLKALREDWRTSIQN